MHLFRLLIITMSLLLWRVCSSWQATSTQRGAVLRRFHNKPTRRPTIINTKNGAAFRFLSACSPVEDSWTSGTNDDYNGDDEDQEQIAPQAGGSYNNNNYRGFDWFENYYSDDDDEDDEESSSTENLPPKPKPRSYNRGLSSATDRTKPKSRPLASRSNNNDNNNSMAAPAAAPRSSIKPSATSFRAAPTPTPKAAKITTPPVQNDATNASNNIDKATEATTTPPTTPETTLFHPHQFCEKDEATGEMKIPYPKALSPSGIKEFLACPQSYLFQYIFGLRQPTTAALAKGSMCHTALERVFDLEPTERTLETLQNLFRQAWSEHRQQDTYKDLFTNVPDEIAWGQQGLGLLENYWQSEDASTVTRPNPVQREVWVKAALPLDPSQGVTCSSNIEMATAATETFLVRGIVDRLDLVQTTPGSKDVCLRLIDYKTGKKPHLKYSPAMNQKIVDEALEQLIIYALLLRESGKARENPMPLRYLRLFYLTSVEGKADYLDMDLGRTEEERDAVLQQVHAKLSQVWKDVQALVDEQNAVAFRGCDRAFCYCHKCRPLFEPGTVWAPPTNDGSNEDDANDDTINQRMYSML